MSKEIIFGMMAVLGILFISSCSKDEEDNDTEETVVKEEPLSPKRIAWDYSSLKKLAGDPYDYTSYPRMIELSNGNFMCVYEANGNIDMISSADKGETWSTPVQIATMKNNTAMAVPEIVQLQNGRIIISYNPRPKQPFSDDRHFAIALKISNDNGNTWGDENVVYNAGSTLNTGCWEPNIIQLPNGELQLYFANEYDYQYTHEQNISMFRSSDNGITWAEREIVSFSEGSRDGMPVAVALNDNEIIMAIEDNKNYNFKPAIISTSNNWGNAPVLRDSYRAYALNHNQRSTAYQGAPYIRKTSAGNIVLSYQGTDGQSNNDLKNSHMHVEIGDGDGTNFNNNTQPFKIPTGKSALWSSLSVMDGKIWALSSTTAYSNKQEVWTIAGYEILEYKLSKDEIVIDGVIDNAEKVFPFFVGHKRNANLFADLSYNDDKIYVSVNVKDATISGVKDYFVINLDPQNISSTNPVSGTYAINVYSNGDMIVKEGFNGKWIESDISIDDITVKENNEGYVAELSIDWDQIGGKPESDKRIGFSLTLFDDYYKEYMANSDGNKPYTWGTTKL